MTKDLSLWFQIHEVRLSIPIPLPLRWMLKTKEIAELF